ncbi:hypothetical protein NQ318_022798, partial [Aromia moschata]
MEVRHRRCCETIIGVDFLAHYGSLVDIGNGRLLDQTTQLTSKGGVVECSMDYIRTVTGSSVFHNLLQKLPQITRPRGAACVAKHQTKHYISTTPGSAVAKKPRHDEANWTGATFVTDLQKGFQDLQPAPVKRHDNKKVFIFEDLTITPQVFVRNDAPRASLQEPYEGPFPVMQRGDKMFLVQIHGREKHISVDILKPVYLINDQVDPQDCDPEDDPVIIPQRKKTAASWRGSQNQHLQHQVQYARDLADMYAFRTVTKPIS